MATQAAEQAARMRAAYRRIRANEERADYDYDGYMSREWELSDACADALHAACQLATADYEADDGSVLMLAYADDSILVIRPEEQDARVARGQARHEAIALLDAAAAEPTAPTSDGAPTAYRYGVPICGVCEIRLDAAAESCDDCAPRISRLCELSGWTRADAARELSEQAREWDAASAPVGEPAYARAAWRGLLLDDWLSRAAPTAAA